MAHPGVPPELRGTYAGLGHEAAMRTWSTRCNAVELLPVHESVPRPSSSTEASPITGATTRSGTSHLTRLLAEVRAGRPGGQVAEFKAMVDALHGAGLEVLLDVVFNHTARATTSAHAVFQGLDNPAYYRLVPGDLRYYIDDTGAVTPKCR